LYYATITVKAEPLAKPSNLVEQNWRWLLPVGFVLTVAAVLLVGMLRKREQRRPSEPRDEGGV
jgi:cytochrome c-type biogenesis protein CcmH/NrfF